MGNDKPIFSTTIEGIARICHEINAAYCRSLGDDSQPPWELLNPELKAAACSGVVYHLHNPLAMPADSHEAWLVGKEAAGWKYGKAEDAEGKKHPAFMPYEELPQEQRTKDYLFKQVIDSTRPFVGL